MDFSKIVLDTYLPASGILSGTCYGEDAWDQAFYGAMRRAERFRFGEEVPG